MSCLPSILFFFWLLPATSVQTSEPLEFGQYGVSQALPGLLFENLPVNGVVQLPVGKASDEHTELPFRSDSSTDAGSSQQTGNGNAGSSPENRRQSSRDNGSSQPPGHDRQTRGQTAGDCFELEINGLVFLIKKHQLSPENRGQEDAQAVKTEYSDMLLPLNQAEEAAGVPEIRQLANTSRKVLDYLVEYGTESTRWALLDFYPVSIVSLQEGYLTVNPRAVIPETALECPICQDAILSRESLIQAECSDIFHPACLVRFMQSQSFENREDIRCPVCRNNLPENTPVMNTNQSLENQLRSAAVRGENAVVKCLLEAGVNADSSDRAGNSALHLATGAGHYHVAEQLVRYGAIPDSANSENLTPIDLAMAKNHPSIAEMLSEAKKTPGIFFAVGHGRADLLDAWLDNGEPVDSTRQPDGLSLLQLAVRHGQLDMVVKLLAYARNLETDIANQTDIHGRTALHYAADCGFVGIAEILIDHDVNVDQADNDGRTALMLAVLRKDAGSAMLLLQNGASPHAEDRTHRTPQMVAEAGGFGDIFSSMSVESEQADGDTSLEETGIHQAAPLSESSTVLQADKPTEFHSDYYQLQVAQTTYRITGKGIQKKLRKTWAFSLDAECQDCQKKVWNSLLRHSNRHIVICLRCQQFVPPEGSLDTRKAALALHNQTCPGKPDNEIPLYIPQVKEDDDSTLSLFFRFGNLSDNQLLLSKVSDDELVRTLSIPNSRKKTPMHVLFQYASEELVYWFLNNKSQLLLANPGLLSQQDHKGWTPLHLLFYRSMPVTQKRFLHLYATLLERNPLLLNSSTRDRWTLYHIVARYSGREVTALFFGLTKRLLQENPLPMKWPNKQGWTFLHTLFFYADPSVILDFLQQFGPILKRHPEILNCPNSMANTPVHFLASKAPLGVMQAFLESDFTSQKQVLTANRNGETALHFLCLNNSLESVRQLLSRYKECIAFGMLTHAVSSPSSELTPKPVAAWSLMDYLVQKASPPILAEWLVEHVDSAISAENIQNLLANDVTWPEFCVRVVSDERLQANWLLQQIVRIYEHPAQLPNFHAADDPQTEGHDICPITGEPIQSKVVTNPCGHQFEQEALERWMAKSVSGTGDGRYRCPTCGRGYTYFIKVYGD